MSPRVSVVMPVHNGERHVRAAIGSILQQSYHDFEFLIVDDASTDATAMILSEVAEGDARVHVVCNEQNLGVTRSLNRALALACGDYVARMDADDISLPCRLEAQARFLTENPQVGVLGTRMAVIDEWGDHCAIDYMKTPSSDADIRQSLWRRNALCHGSVMMRRDILEQAGGYDEYFVAAQDYDLWLRLLPMTQFANLGETFYLFRIHPDSVSGRDRFNQYFFATQALEQAASRTFGAATADDLRMHLALGYIQAATEGARTGRLAEASVCGRKALHWEPRTGRWVAPMRITVRSSLAQISFDDSGPFLHALFDVTLPRTQVLAQLRSELEAEIRLRRLYEHAERREYAPILPLLWSIGRWDWRQLLNRSIPPIVARSVLARLSEPSEAQSC